MAVRGKKCAHPPCSGEAVEGSKYCSVEYGAVERTPALECLCPHPGSRGKVV